MLPIHVINSSPSSQYAQIQLLSIFSAIIAKKLDPLTDYLDYGNVGNLLIENVRWQVWAG